MPRDEITISRSGKILLDCFQNPYWKILKLRPIELIFVLKALLDWELFPMVLAMLLCAATPLSPALEADSRRVRVLEF